MNYLWWKQPTSNGHSYALSPQSEIPPKYQWRQLHQTLRTAKFHSGKCRKLNKVSVASSINFLVAHLRARKWDLCLLTCCILGGKSLRTRVEKVKQLEPTGKITLCDLIWKEETNNYGISQERKECKYHAALFKITKWNKVQLIQSVLHSLTVHYYIHRLQLHKFKLNAEFHLALQTICQGKMAVSSCWL